MSDESKDKGPVLLDPLGNEVCWLFLKYGKCRYKKKCKRSHILPDKDAFMQQVIPTTVEQPVVNSGPKISFPIRKTPYTRPLPHSSTSTEPFSKKERQFSKSTNQQAIQHHPNRQGTGTAGKETGHDDLTQQGIKHHDEEMRSPKVDHPISVDPPKAVDTVATTTATSDDHEMTPIAQHDQKPKKPKRPAKTRSKCLLTSLFTTTIPNSAVRESYHQPSVNTFVVGQPASGTSARGKKAAGSASGSKDRSGTSQSTNEATVSGEKIEQWYITNKAYLDPESRKLMVLTKPTTARQVNQLKAMRKHHWECRTEMEHQLRKNIPGTYSLKVARGRIDWERVAPYVALMIQAAFEMDIEHQHLPVIGTTLCMLLEHKSLGGVACEELLVSWGLTEIDARRFTSHLWDVMVAAAGEADVRGSKGFSFHVRQYEDTEDYKRLQHRLFELNKAPE